MPRDRPADLNDTAYRPAFVSRRETEYIAHTRPVVAVVLRHESLRIDALARDDR